MIGKQFEYKIKAATEKDIYSHLEQCNENFITPLSEKVDIGEYSKKLFNNAITFEAWEHDILAGLVAAYFNYPGEYAFISNVTVLQKFMRLGIASKLLHMCIGYASKNNMREIKLEVDSKNNNAISFYQKFAFVVNDVKKDDLIMNLYLNDTYRPDNIKS